MNNNSNSINPVKEFEDAFDACIGVLANSNCQQSIENDELKLSIEQCAQKFIDKARELETFFIQKRFQITSQRPEQIIMEDISDIKSEIARKDQLIERFNEKINHWQNNILNDNSIQPTMLIGQPPPPPPNLMNNVQQQQQQQQQQLVTQQQPHPSMNIRQRSPIQQPIMQSNNIPSNNMQSPMHTPSMRPQTMMSPHPFQQAQTYTPQMMNMQPNQAPLVQPTQQTANTILPDSPMSQPIQSPMNHQMGQIHPMQSTNYPATNNPPVQSHLAFLEKTTSSIGLPDNRK